MYEFSVDYNTFDIRDVWNIGTYLMKKHYVIKK